MRHLWMFGCALAAMVAGRAVADDLQTAWSHVYHPGRLQIITLKASATGILVHCRPEKDGDLHCLLKLDPGQESLLNQKNIDAQHGYLVVEPICVGKVTQADAIPACKGYVNHISIPPPGSHVRVYGSHVLDTEHGWRELHPISAIEILAPKPPDGEAEDACLGDCLHDTACADRCFSRDFCPSAE